ncbi:RES family NAD+ phosphorylase [Rhizobium sp. RAF56]|uniref:RES family NAD+ phosphorylase n=1 Tax=Rhizobium sp. RAF56 TaxID=3233062 RepID=UPI003F9A39F9
MYLGRYPDRLGFGKTPSRFSDPRRRKPANRFGVLYMGDTVKVCFLEALLRDQRDGLIGDLPIAESELRDRQFAQIEVIEPLTMVDLRDDGAIKMGVPTDVAKSSKQSLAREWAVAFHEHRDHVDGIIYPSRLNGHTNLAVFDRSIGKLKAVGATRLIWAPGLANVLDDLKVAIIGP